MNYSNTPGVKIKEVSLLPPSIVQVSTAIPIFLGYTEMGLTTTGEPVRISSLKEYEDQFNKGQEYGFDVVENNGVYTATKPSIKFFFYEAIKLYFMNGGGACYILPLGQSSANNISSVDFTEALPLIEKLDEPTIIAFPEAVDLVSSDYGSVVGAALTVCSNTKDKFTLIDSPNSLDLLDFNAAGDLENFRGVISGDISYGAAYYPPLETVVKITVDKSNISITGGTLPVVQSAAYNDMMQAISKASNVTIPPSALMAGVYAKIDRDYGVWKAPANIALQGVIKPIVAISDEMQENLNVDATSGKSINAIREFTGKGSVVWGARTLKGNSNEWRYIQVRRLFITVEESVKKATSQFVFENNDSKTWVKVSSMIRSYLNGLWKDGALTGATADEAFFVQVGLGTTMTEQDVLEGKMIVQIGLAAVRPAEFIVLEFSHFVNQ